MKVIETDKTLTIICKGNVVSFQKTDKLYIEVLEALSNDDIDTIIQLKNLTNLLLTGEAEFIEEGITLNNKIISTPDSKLIKFIKKLKVDGIDDDQIKFIKPFLDNAFANPYIDAVEELYDFCEAQDFVITEDGCFLAYKNVNNNFTSIHDNKTDHSIGNIVKENYFDTDRTQTCSKGLHFCSKGYLQHFKAENGRTIIVKVNPKDVVAIPTDYNHMKGRCKQYEVIAELKEDNIKAYYRNTK